MSQYFEIHPENPQNRLIQQAAKIIADGGVVVYPTDSCYALGWRLGDTVKVRLTRVDMDSFQVQVVPLGVKPDRRAMQGKDRRSKTRRRPGPAVRRF